MEGLKLNIQKTEIMASGPITWWQIDGETMETMTEFIFLSSKIIADGFFTSWATRKPLGKMVENKEELKSLLMKVKEESE